MNLINCPFCNSKAQIETIEYGGSATWVSRIFCTNGCVTMTDLYGPPQEIKKFWNKRYDKKSRQVGTGTSSRRKSRVKKSRKKLKKRISSLEKRQHLYDKEPELEEIIEVKVYCEACGKSTEFDELEVKGKLYKTCKLCGHRYKPIKV